MLVFVVAVIVLLILDVPLLAVALLLWATGIRLHEEGSYRHSVPLRWWGISIAAASAIPFLIATFVASIPVMLKLLGLLFIIGWAWLPQLAYARLLRDEIREEQSVILPIRQYYERERQQKGAE